LHTTDFSPDAARRLFDSVSAYGSLIKGHYTDWVSNPADYPLSGMGGANVGPEFTAEEYLALADLCAKEEDLTRSRRGVEPSHFMSVLEQAVYDSGRWRKWLQPDEYPTDLRSRGVDIWGKAGEGESVAPAVRQIWENLSPGRRLWLTQTGARYMWTAPSVVAARQALYDNLAAIMPDPHAAVVERIGRSMDRYVVAFHLFDSLTPLS
jgi:hypothetical protein